MNKDKKWLKRPSKRILILLSAFVVTGLLAWLVLGLDVLGIRGGKEVRFEVLAKDNYPASIEKEVIPEYRELERALGCLIDGKVYVVVTRGEKPTAGYGIVIDEMIVEKTSDGSNLRVEVEFEEPEEGVAYSTVTTYPYAVAKTELTALPDTIELVVEYDD